MPSCGTKGSYLLSSSHGQVPAPYTMYTRLLFPGYGAPDSPGRPPISGGFMKLQISELLTFKQDEASRRQEIIRDESYYLYILIVITANIRNLFLGFG